MSNINQTNPYNNKNVKSPIEQSDLRQNLLDPNFKQNASNFTQQQVQIKQFTTSQIDANNQYDGFQPISNNQQLSSFQYEYVNRMQINNSQQNTIGSRLISNQNGFSQFQSNINPSSGQQDQQSLIKGSDSDENQKLSLEYEQENNNNNTKNNVYFGNKEVLMHVIGQDTQNQQQNTYEQFQFQEHQQVTNFNGPITTQNQQFRNNFTKRVKVRAWFNQDTKKYEVKQKSRDFLLQYQIDPTQFDRTLRQIEGKCNLRPFENRSPILRRIFFKVLSLIAVLALMYVCFIVLQLALLNLILLGMMLITINKFHNFLSGLEHKADVRFKNKALQKFIEDENSKYYTQFNVELVSDEEGRLIELQLPDDLDDLRKKHQKIVKQNSKNGIRVRQNQEEEQQLLESRVQQQIIIRKKNESQDEEEKTEYSC